MIKNKNTFAGKASEQAAGSSLDTDLQCTLTLQVFSYHSPLFSHRPNTHQNLQVVLIFCVCGIKVTTKKSLELNNFTYSLQGTSFIYQALRSFN